MYFVLFLIVMVLTIHMYSVFMQREREVLESMNQEANWVRTFMPGFVFIWLCAALGLLLKILFVHGGEYFLTYIP